MGNFIALKIEEREIPIPFFISAIQKAKANPTSEWPFTLKKWWSGTGADIVREYREIINENINLRGNLKIRCLKSESWYRHAQRLLNSNAVIREHDIPRKLRKRFNHRITRGRIA